MNKAKTISPEKIQEQKQIMEYVAAINKGKNKKAFVETYGCQQNVSDSETIMGMLSSMGYSATDNKEEADFIIYNTCAVRENAELKVYGNLGALKHLKARRPEVILGVCGCMMQQESVKETIRKKYKHIDIVMGTHSLYRFPSILRDALEKGERVLDVVSSDGAIAEGLPVCKAPGPCAWVSVMYGCNNFCSYCIVPYVRGRERSRDKEDILREVRQCVANGAKEVTLLGQNVNSYGNDLEEDIDFADLLTLVCRVEGIERVRFMTSHPKDISDKLIDTMAREDKICKQLHLPIQAGNNRVLKTMNRRYTRESYMEKIAKIKEKMPGIALTTDIIVGFPGETTEEFEDTLDVLREVRYDTIFSFIYSKRPGTPAAQMEDVITPEEKKRNFDRLLEVQDEISKEKNLALQGKVVRVLTEGVSKNNKDALMGRTQGGKTVNFEGSEDLIGNFVDVEITDAKTWSLTGKVKKMNKIIEKARELGMMIAESDEIKALKGAEEMQLSDPDAQVLMMEYATKREEIAKKASDPAITKEDFEKIQAEMEEAFAKIMTNENIKRYVEANRDFKNLIDQVNSIIAFFVKGEEQQGSCSGNCSTCGGCN